jgi:hypothetical protein
MANVGVAMAMQKAGDSEKFREAMAKADADGTAYYLVREPARPGDTEGGMRFALQVDGDEKHLRLMLGVTGIWWVEEGVAG